MKSSEVVYKHVDSGWTGTTVLDMTTNCTVDVSNLSSLSWPPPLHSYTTLQISLISMVVAVLSIVTAGGNLMVIISFRMDRQLQTVSNYFLLSLSVADFAIGLVSMPLYTVYLLMKRWPLGPVVCDAWLSLDYTMSNASVANLLVISFDRYFSVTRPLTYRVRRTPRTAAALIAGAWLVSVLLWTPWIIAWPHIEGRREVPDNQCYIQFLETNQYITVVTAVAAFYLPVLAMCVVYYRIYRETERRQRGLLYLQATSSSFSRLGKTPTIDEDPSMYVEMSSRRSSYGRTRLSTMSANAFVQSPTPLHYRVQLTRSDASERRPRRRGLVTRCLCCGVSVSRGAVHTPPRKSSNSVDDLDSALPAGARGPPQRSAATESPIPLIRVGSQEAITSKVVVETHRRRSVSDGSSATSTPPSGTAIGLETTGCWQASDAVDEQPSARQNKEDETSKRSVVVEALLLDRDEPRIISCTDDSNQVRRASESPCTSEDTQHSKVSSDALRQALEKRINERLTDTARKAQKQRQEKKQDRKAAKTLSAILLAFIVTWTPYNVFTVVRTFVPTWIDPTVYAIGKFLCLLAIFVTVVF